jgi:hypothetical protein
MMNKIFYNEIANMLEVYVDDMIVKSAEEGQHEAHLSIVFDKVRKHNMRLNTENVILV